MAITQKEQTHIALHMTKAVWDVYTETTGVEIPTLTDCRKICDTTNKRLEKLGFKDRYGPLQMTPFDFLTRVYNMEHDKARDLLFAGLEETA